MTKMDDMETWMVFFQDSEGKNHALVSKVRREKRKRNPH
jgi:hypothetical protein